MTKTSNKTEPTPITPEVGEESPTATEFVPTQPEITMEDVLVVRALNSDFESQLTLASIARTRAENTARMTAEGFNPDE